MGLHFKEAFTFMFNDKKLWYKYLIFVLIGLLLLPATLFPFFPPHIKTINLYLGVITMSLFFSMFLSGYMLTYTNSRISDNENSLPEWTDNFKRFLFIGFKYLVGALLFLTALLLIMTVLLLIITTIWAIISVRSNPGLPPELFANSLIFPITITMFALFVPLMFIFFMGYSSFIVDLKILSFFNFKRSFILIKSNFVNLLVIYLVCFAYLVIMHFINKINSMVYLIILMLIPFYVTLVFSNLMAQYTKLGIEKNMQE